MFRFPSVICTRCTGFFCLAIIKGPPNDIYCTIEEPSKHYFTEKVSYSRKKDYNICLRGKNPISCFQNQRKPASIIPADSQLFILLFDLFFFRFLSELFLAHQSICNYKQKNISGNIIYLFPNPHLS